MRALYWLTTGLLAVLLSTQTAAAQCLTDNGDFEGGLRSWTRAFGDSDKIKIKDDDGNATLEVNEAGAQQVFPVLAGSTLRLDLRQKKGDKSNWEDQPFVRLQFQDNGGGAVGAPIIHRWRGQGEWRARSWDNIAVPAGATRLRLLLACVDDKVQWDDICVRQVSAGGTGEGSHSAAECGINNGDLEDGITSWPVDTQAPAIVSAQTEGGNGFLRAERAWVATPLARVRGGEQYLITWRARQVDGAGGVPWVSAKYHTAPWPAGRVIREERISTARLTADWTAYEATIVVPTNATVMEFVMAGSHVGTFDLDDVCLRATAEVAGGCLTDAQSASAWANYTEVVDYKGRTDVLKLDDVIAVHRFDAASSRVYGVDAHFYGANDGGKPSTFSVFWYGAGNSYIRTDTLASESFPQEWREQQYTVTSPPGAVRAELRIGNEQKKVYLSDVCLKDYGESGVASAIRGRVWLDGNEDGRRDPDETNLAGARILLYRDNGDGAATPEADELVASRVSTSLDYDYVFTDLPPGDYYLVAYLLPTRFLAAYRQPGVEPQFQNHFENYTFRDQSAARTNIYALDGDNTVRYLNLGQRRSGLAAISGYAWNDADGNRFRDEDPKSGVNGLTVAAYLSDGTFLRETQTMNDPDGNPGYFIFNFVDLNDVYLELDVPTGVTVLSPATPGDAAFDAATARTPVYDLTANTLISNVSASLQLSDTEVCGNGIDDDRDGRIDDEDSDCTTCVRRAEIPCGDPFRHYVPPVWRMDDAGAGSWVPDDVVAFTGPAYFIITTDAPETEVRIASPDGTWPAGQAFARYTARRGEELRIPVPTWVMQSEFANSRRSGKGVIIESDDPINASYFLDAFYNKALITMKGEQALGNRFFAGSQTMQSNCDSVRGAPGHTPAMPNTNAREAHFISVMATEDDTRVTFDWNPWITKYEGFPDRVPGVTTATHTVTLDRGETYLMRDAYTNETVSGTRVTSDKAITVLSGSQHTRVCHEGGRDAGIDQLVPECYVGNEYIAVKHGGADVQHYVVVVPTQNGTEVRMDGVLRGTVDALDYLQVPVTGDEGDPHYIETTAPAYVYHVSGISVNNEVGMALAASFGECRGNRYLSFARGIDDPNVERAVNVIIPTTAVDSLRLNGSNDTTGMGLKVEFIPGRTDYLSLVIPGHNLQEVNVLESDGYFQAAMLIGIPYATGTFGYLTRFARSIQVLDPDSGAPTARYSLPGQEVCGGTTVPHTLKVLSCGTDVEIVSVSNNSNVGTVTVTGALSFDYSGLPTAYDSDNIRVRLRDGNGVESSVCISTFVCGSGARMSGLPDGATLSCGETIPAANPYVAGGRCPVALPILHRDSTVAGSCPNNYTVYRIWEKPNSCNTVIREVRTFQYRDNVAPTATYVPPTRTYCGPGTLPTDQPTFVDRCGGAVTVTEAPIRYVDFPGTAYREAYREWTATDDCSNVATASQQIRIVETPQRSAPLAATDAACALDNGTLTIRFEEDNRRTGIQFSLNGQWRGIIGDELGQVTYSGLAAGTYAVRARWGDGSCAVDFGSVTIGDLALPGSNTISAWQTGCTPFDPARLEGSDAGAGVEYRWESRPWSGTWSAVATTRHYDPPSLTSTREYRRGVRRGSACAFTYSNMVRVTLTWPLTDAGTLSGNQTNCGPFTPGPVTSVSDASGGSGGTVHYRWQQRLEGQTWTDIGGASAKTYQPAALTQTTHFRRVATRGTVGGANCVERISNVVTKTVLPAPTASAGADRTICTGDATTLAASVTGGSGGVTYAWDRGLGTGANKTVSPLTTTTYTVTATDSRGCASTAQVTVTVHDRPAVTVATTDPSTCGGTDGRVSFSFPSHAYRTGIDLSTDGGATFTEVALSSGTYVANGLSAGAYALAARWGDNTCPIDLGTVTLADPAAPTATITTSGADDCAGTVETIRAANQGAGASYTWTIAAGPGRAEQTVAGARVDLPLATSAAAEFIPVTLTVRRNGCTATASTTVRRRAPAVSFATADALTPISGCGRADGQLSITAPNPSGSCLELRLSGRAWGTARTWSGIAPGTYTVEVRYCNEECGGAYAKTFTFADPAPPTVNLGPDRNICAGETALIGAAATGGASPYTYAWSDGQSGEQVSVNPNTGTDYTVTVTDANGCTATDVIRVDVNARPAATATGTGPSLCSGNDGTITFAFADAGSRSHLSLSIDGGASYTTVLDNSGAYTFTGLRAGVYDLYARWGDSSCPVDLPDVTLSDPPNVVADFTHTGPDDCHGAVETFTTTAVLGASYAWDFGAGATPQTATGQSVTATFTTDRGTDSIPVTLTVTRAGCTTTVTKPIRRRTSANAQVATVTPSSPTSCSGTEGRLDLDAPNPPAGCLEFSVDGANWTQARTISGLAAGTYTLRARYCNAECEEVVGTYTLSDPPAPTLATGPSLDICAGSTATLEATGAGGTAPYAYTWDNGGGSGQTVGVTPSAETVYKATVTDAAGCTATARQRVRVAPAATVALAIDDLGAGASLPIADGDRFHLSRLPASWNIAGTSASAPARVIFNLRGAASGNRVVSGGAPLVYRTPGQHLGLAAGTYRLRTRVLAADVAGAEVCTDVTVEFHLEDYEICDNGVDDDGDGATDCEDDACPKPPPVTDVQR